MKRPSQESGDISANAAYSPPDAVAALIILLSEQLDEFHFIK
jgi:hypothetical protein